MGPYKFSTGQRNHRPWRPTTQQKTFSASCLFFSVKLYQFVIYTAPQKHESTLLQCTERIFDSRPFMYNKIFLKTLLQKLVAHISMLFLALFASKFVNQSRHSETLNFRKNSKLTSFSFENSDFTVFKHFSKTHCASQNWPVWTQKGPKEA